MLELNKLYNMDCMELVFNNNYLIFKNGEIYSKRSRKFLKKQISTTGYYIIMIKRKSHKIHRLVAMHFIENFENKACINHKDGDKLNNNIDNLEWCTHSENLIHAHRNNLNKNIGETHYNSKINKEIANKIREDYKAKNITQNELAKKYKISRTHVTSIINNRYWKNEL